MIHYFLVAALIYVPALLWTLFTGLLHQGGERHFWAGLFTAILGVALHTLVILFVLVTGRVLREAMRTRPLDPELLAELNQFFANMRAYPLAGLGAASIVAAGVLGYTQYGFGISPTWHLSAGLLAVALNLWALQQEFAALHTNQHLIDRAASALDAFDRELAARGESVPDEPAPPPSLARIGLSLAIGAWLPYLYWALITWRGDFSRVSFHPWIEICAAGLLLAWIGRKGRTVPDRDPDPSSSRR